MSSSASYKLPVQNSPNHKQKYDSPFITQITLMSLPQQNNNNKTTTTKPQNSVSCIKKKGRRENLPVLVHQLKAKHASEKH